MLYVQSARTCSPSAMYQNLTLCDLRNKNNNGSNNGGPISSVTQAKCQSGGDETCYYLRLREKKFLWEMEWMSVHHMTSRSPFLGKNMLQNVSQSNLSIDSLVRVFVWVGSWYSHCKKSHAHSLIHKMGLHFILKLTMVENGKSPRYLNYVVHFHFCMSSTCGWF